MHRFVNTLALTAAVVTLGAGLWQDWGLLVTMKKVLLSYMGFFFLSGLMALAFLAVPLFETGDKSKVDNGPEEARKQN